MAQVTSTDWKERKREEVFEGTLKGLENRRRIDPEFGLEEARSSLEHLYVLDGNNWLGRGELGDIVSEATIAAYEHFIHEWSASEKTRSEEAGRKGGA
ncbi:MAG TPA: hypothetical protein VIO60_01800 [Rectinemataceae bacterium]